MRTRGGQTVNVAALPFLSHRYAVRAAEVLLHEFAEHTLDYARQVAAIVAVLTEGFTGDAVNVVMAHATLLGGRRGGGERDVQTSLGYELPASMFPPNAHYVALGHLHRCQEIPGPGPMFYSGSPLAVDFGEQDNDPSVLIVTAAPGVRAGARPVPVTSYLPAEQAAVVSALRPGQRTPAFTMGTSWRRTSWYMQLPRTSGVPWSGVVRLECSADLPLPGVTRLGDLTARLLPPLASAPHKDPRAPQNLVPIGGLERELRHRLGDQHVRYHALRAAAMPVR